MGEPLPWYFMIPLSKVLLGWFHLASHPSKEWLEDTFAVMNVLLAKNPEGKTQF